jgi:hypothetical protein
MAVLRQHTRLFQARKEAAEAAAAAEARTDSDLVAALVAAAKAPRRPLPSPAQAAVQRLLAAAAAQPPQLAMPEPLARAGAGGADARAGGRSGTPPTPSPPRLGRAQTPTSPWGQQGVAAGCAAGPGRAPSLMRLSMAWKPMEPLEHPFALAPRQLSPPPPLQLRR